MRMLPKILIAAATFIISAAPVRAAEYIYTPEGCDFTVRLPSVPSTIRRCHPVLPDKCWLTTAFTHVYGLEATLNVYLKCDPVAQEEYEGVTEDAIRTALIALSATNLESYQSNTEQHDDMYIGMLLGVGRAPSNNEALYTSQMWITPHSKLTIEGEIIGGEHPDADETLIEVLHSVQRKGAALKTDMPDLSPKADTPSDMGEDMGAESTGSSVPAKPAQKPAQ